MTTDHLSARIALILLSASLAAAQDVTTASLLADTGDLWSVAGKPKIGYSARQFSSYDRRTTRVEDQGDDGWYANGDQGHFLRVEERDGKKEWVMADADGPGAVVRIWSADPKGTLRFYLDGAAAPAIEADMATYLSGRHALAPAPMAGERSKGWNSHMPVPYAKRLKVTVSEKQLYYHVNIRTYPPATAVATWTPAEQTAAQSALAAAARRLGPSTPPDFPADRVNDLEMRIEPGEEHGAQTTVGMRGAIIGLGAEITSAPDVATAWRRLVLRIDFDGERCVEAPLGDFFGSGPDMPAYASLPMGVTQGGLAWSRWPMPYGEGYKIRLVNLGAEAVKVRLVIAEGPIPDDLDLYHFRADWRQEVDFKSHPHRDWNCLTVDSGAGFFVGCAMSIANPVRDWWGEGDEKFFIDGETFPSTIGTGTEDYFGYAWCCPLPFEHALHGQPRCDGPGNRGLTALYRWQISDAVPFTKSFRFEMECWHWRECVMSQSMTVYWYGTPGSRSHHAPIVAADLVLPRIPPLQVHRVAGALEGEDLKVLAYTAEIERQELSGFAADKWSGDRHLWWRGGKKGDRLVVEFNAPAAGRYRVKAAFTVAGDYGIHQVSINGLSLGEPRNFFNATVNVRPEEDLGTLMLEATGNRLEVEIVGADAKARPGLMFGLDYLRLEAAGP